MDRLSGLVVLQLDVLGPQTFSLVLVVAGILLSVAEALAPGAHFVVVGVALLAAGLLGLVLGPLASPFVLGALVLAFGGLALYGYREFDLYGGKGSGRTSDSTSLKGQTGRVTERVTPSEGQVKLESGGFNPYYAARSIDGTISDGTEVIVVDPGGGNVVTVESLDAIEDDIDRELARGRERGGERDERATADEETETDRA
ncbi:MAG: NfeD family protein [Haloferacaceae archaeon]